MIHKPKKGSFDGTGYSLMDFRELHWSFGPLF